MIVKVLQIIVVASGICQCQSLDCWPHSVCKVSGEISEAWGRSLCRQKTWSQW